MEPENEADLDRWVTDAKVRAARFEDMRTGVEQVSVTQSSQDGVVTVTVDAAGNITDLRISDRVRDMRGVKVASLVLTTMRHAQARIADQVANVMEATVGTEKSTMDTVLSHYRRRFPESERQESAPSPGNEETEF